MQQTQRKLNISGSKNGPDLQGLVDVVERPHVCLSLQLKL